MVAEAAPVLLEVLVVAFQPLCAMAATSSVTTTDDRDDSKVHKGAWWKFWPTKYTGKYGVQWQLVRLAVNAHGVVEEWQWEAKEEEEEKEEGTAVREDQMKRSRVFAGTKADLEEPKAKHTKEDTAAAP